jgi:CBS domain containing-hemolysin-like protein
MTTLLYIIAVLVLVAANGFFVASEFALVGVRRSRVETLASAGNQRAKRLLDLLDDLNAYISATQLGITMASLALGWIGEPVFAHLLEAPLKDRVSEVTLHTISFALAFSIITFLHIVLGELAPKTLALERTERIALAISWPMQKFYKVFRWPIRLLDSAGTWTVRLFGLRPGEHHGAAYTEEELRHLIDLSRISGHVKADEQQLIHRIFEFGDAQVREAMVPRNQIEALPLGVKLEEARSAFIKTGYSRLPVYRKTLDEIVGLLFRKDFDMGRIPAEGFDVMQLVRAPTYIPANTSLGRALKHMQATRVHFMFVIDEYGGTEGVLTLEDLLEEIVGEINDEYDEEVREQIRKDASSYLLDGMLTIRDANRQLKLTLPENEPYTTIAGFLMAETGRVLQAGDKVETDAGVFLIEQVDNRSIKQVRFVRSPGKVETLRAPASLALVASLLMECTRA